MHRFDQTFTEIHDRHEDSEMATLEVEVSISGMISNSGNITSYLASSDVLGRGKEISNFVKNSLKGSICFQDFPRMMILLKVCILSDDGSVLSAALNASVLALLNSGIPMTSTPIATNVLFTASKILTDPCLEEEQKANANFTIAFENGTSPGECAGMRQVASVCEGCFDEHTFEQALIAAEISAHITHQFFLTAVPEI